MSNGSNTIHSPCCNVLVLQTCFSMLQEAVQQRFWSIFALWKKMLPKSISHCAADRMSSAKQIVDSSKTLQACSCWFVARVVPTLSCPFSPSWVFCINRNATEWLVLLIMSADFCRMIQHCLLMLPMLAAPHYIQIVFLLIVFISDTRKPYSRKITLLS